jgi:hypothetical protein
VHENVRIANEAVHRRRAVLPDTTVSRRAGQYLAVAGRDEEGCRYCPSCGDEFQSWVLSCPDCEVATADEPPAPGPEANVSHRLVRLDVTEMTVAAREQLRWRLEVEHVPHEWEGPRTLVVPEDVVGTVDALAAEMTEGS